MVMQIDTNQNDLLEQAIRHQQNGEFAESEALYDVLIEAGLNDSDVYYLRALARLSGQNVDGAVADLERAVALSPDLIDYRLVLGELRLNSEQFDEAREDFQMVLDVDARNDQANFLMATLCHAQQHWDQAETYFQTAMAYSQDVNAIKDAYARFLMAWAYAVYEVDQDAAYTQATQAVGWATSDELRRDMEAKRAEIDALIVKRKLTEEYESLFDRFKNQYAEKVDDADLETLLSRTVDPAEIHKAVSISCHGRSGSYLFGSMFDAHPCVVQLMVSWVNGFYLGQMALPHLSDKAMIAATMKYALDEGSDYYAFGGDDTGLYRNKFVATFLALAARYDLKTNRRGTLLRMALLSYHAAHDMPRPVAPVTLVYHMHTLQPDIAKCLAADFDDVQLLTIVRKPDQAVASHLRHHIEEWKIMPYAITPENIYRQYLTHDEALTGLGDHVKVGAVCFEHVHSATRYVAEQIAAFTGIPFDEAMLQSTMNGQPWGLRRVVNGKAEIVSGFGHNKTLKKQPRWFSAIDKARLYAVSLEACRSRGYNDLPWLNIPILRYLTLLVLMPFPFAAEKEAWKLALQADLPPDEKNRKNFEESAKRLRDFLWQSYRDHRSGARQFVKPIYKLPDA